jgi:uncharacterized protein
MAQTQRAIPPLNAQVIDQTGTLQAADVQALTAVLHGIEQQHGSQVVMLMVPSTAPEDIAAFANRVGNQWKIGRRDVGDGVLVVVAKDERRMRIEVAKALEGAIPDIAAAQIIDREMAPRFRQGDYAGGLTAAAEQLRARIAGEALPAPETEAGHAVDDGSLDWSDLAIFLFGAVILGGHLLRKIFGRLLGSTIMGGVIGMLAFWATSSLVVAIAAGGLALLVVGLFGGKSGSVIQAPHTGGWSGESSSSSSGSSWSSSSDYSSGGGGDFGGGGASGDW